MSDANDPTLTPAVNAWPDKAQLLVIDGLSSFIAPLPAEGDVMIGRASECEIRLDDAACSRRHARLHVHGGAVVLEDLGSHNGTRLNGERIAGRHPVTSDDVISIGPIKLVLHAYRRARPGVPLEAAALHARLVQEVERAVSYERPLSVAVVTVEGTSRWIANTMMEYVRLVDVIGVLDEQHVVIMMPELLPEAARASAERMLDVLPPGGTRSIGLASCPEDACTAESLIAAARAAAARGGGVRLAGECVEQLDLGGATAIVADAAMVQIYELVKRLGPSDITVLISGETGAGKEKVACALHQWSSRASHPFVAIDCASLPEALVESELFGYERNAFTGATTAKAGRLESAGGGTIFFDELGELSLHAQAKLLRALETRRVTRVGGLKETELDVRIVAATNRNLAQEVKAGRFREDLYFRLAGATVVLPALRDRPRELAVLARFFLERAATSAKRPAPELSTATLAALARYRWPGNVRELKSEMEYLVATVVEPVVEPWHLSERFAAPAMAPPRVIPAASPSDTAAAFRPIRDELRDLERRRMREALAAAGGVQKRAAELIDMPLRTFAMKYKQYGLGDV